MARFRFGKSRGLTALALTLLTAFLGLSLRSPEGLMGDGLARASYDALHRLATPGDLVLEDAPVTIVYLDLTSHLRLKHDPTRPWPRDLHAQLIERLTRAGARAVVFDIVFSGAGPDPAADQALARAMRDNGHVFLAGEINTSSQSTGGGNRGRMQTVQPPFPLFAEAAEGWGVASLAVDDDFVVRRFFARLSEADVSGLAWATATKLEWPVTQTPRAVEQANRRWMRYYAPPYSIPHVSFSDALDPATVADEVFRDRIVLVGARPMIELFHERKDEFRSPLRSLDEPDHFMPGVEVHATQLLNLARGDWLSRLDTARESLCLILVALGAGAGLVFLRPLPAAGVALVGAALGLIGARVGFAQGVWVPWLIASAVQIPVGLAGSVLFNSAEWYRTRRRLEALKKQAEIKIREQAELIDKAHDAILVQDPEGRVIHANPSAERLYGWSQAGLRREGAGQQLFAPDEAAARQARRLALRDGEWNGELRQQTRDGRVVTVASRWTLIRDERGQPRGLLLINSDITEKKQLEQQFLRTQRMNTVGTLAGGMAHDLNNALAPVLMGVQLLRRKPQDEETAQLLGMMETSTHRGAELVRQVLLFARGRGGDLEQVDLAVLIKELERMVRETFPASITVESYVAGDLWPARGNPTQLHQVLLNLCVNARDAMPEGGKLSFIADNVVLEPEEAGTLEDASAGEHVSVSVSDTGTGMSPEVRARIFEPFFTTKEEGRGTGIGLATVKRIVNNHGGCIRVESEPGRGTTFEILLPRAVETGPAEPAARVEVPRGAGELILVADDEIAIRDLMRAELISHGYQVMTAADGRELLDLFEQHADEVRMVVTDGTMPVLDGVRAAAEIRRARPKLPILFTSGEATKVDSSLPEAQVLGKPFALDDLLMAVGRGLRP